MSSVQELGSGVCALLPSPLFQKARRAERSVHRSRLRAWGMRSVVDPTTEVWYTNEIVDNGGVPEFRVTAADAPEKTYRSEFGFA